MLNIVTKRPPCFKPRKYYLNPAPKTHYLFCAEMKPTDLRGILRYIPQFREKTFVLAVDGAIVTDENFATLLLDVAELRSLDIPVVVVHGASAQLKALPGKDSVKASNAHGNGINV